MQASQIPVKFPLPFAADAAGGYITTPVPLAPGAPNRASLQLGFPPSTFAPGGAPAGQDFNGLAYQSTAWLQWLNAGGPVGYDAAFQTAIGGYPQGARLLAAAGTFDWISTVDNNLTDPDASGAGWVKFIDPSFLIPSGSIQFFVGSAPPAGWLECNGAAISRTTFSALNTLANAVSYGVPWGVGNGTTTFNLPDLRGQFLRGWADSGSVDSGRTFGSSQTDQLQAVVYPWDINLVSGTSTGFSSGGDNPIFMGKTAAQTGAAVSDGSHGTPRQGSETRPVNVALLPIIKT